MEHKKTQSRKLRETQERMAGNKHPHTWRRRSLRLDTDSMRLRCAPISVRQKKKKQQQHRNQNQNIRKIKAHVTKNLLCPFKELHVFWDETFNTKLLFSVQSTINVVALFQISISCALIGRKRGVRNNV